MNISTFSPVLVLCFAFTALCILMDVDFKALPRKKTVIAFSAITVLCVINQLLRWSLGITAYSALIFFTMHLPFFLLFIYITGTSTIKMFFMVMSTLVFTTPTVLVSRFVRQAGFSLSSPVMLAANVLTYCVLLFIVCVAFRKGLNYMLKYGDDELFLRFSAVPLIYYVYFFLATNADFSQLTTPAARILRIIPPIQIFVFYCLLPYIFKEFGEKNKLESIQLATNQRLSAAQERIELLNESQKEIASIQHDMRHHLVILEGLLSQGNAEKAEDFVKKLRADLEQSSPKYYCENETVNLLCSSFAAKAKRNGISFEAFAKLPKKLCLSDTEICSLISNGLENALHAAQNANGEKKVTFYCVDRNGNMLLEITNTYSGKIIMQGGIPVTDRAGHSYGCRSIKSIVDRRNGLCSFEAQDSIFTLRIVLPPDNVFDKASSKNKTE